MSKTSQDITDWAIGEALQSGTTPEQIAHNIDMQTTRDEAIRIVRQLLIDKSEYAADLEKNDDVVLQQLNQTLTNLAVDVQEAIVKYL